LDEDAHRIKNRYIVDNVVTQWLTWCERTFIFLGM